MLRLATRRACAAAGVVRLAGVLVYGALKWGKQSPRNPPQVPQGSRAVIVGAKGAFVPVGPRSLSHMNHFDRRVSRFAARI